MSDVIDFNEPERKAGLDKAFKYVNECIRLGTGFAVLYDSENEPYKVCNMREILYNAITVAKTHYRFNVFPRLHSGGHIHYVVPVPKQQKTEANVIHFNNQGDTNDT